MRHLLMISVIVLIVTGCSTRSNNEASPSQQNNDHQVRVEQSAPPKPEINDAGGVANRLEQLATSVPGINNATCVVIGNTAIVGIDVSGKLDRSRVGTLKYSVAEALRKDPYGMHAIVTADLDIKNRLIEIRRDIQAGRPLSGFAEELADIIGRAMPQLPRNIMPKQQPEGQKSDRSKLQNKSLIQ